MKRELTRCYKEISTKGKVSIPGDTAHTDKAFGLFPSPACTSVIVENTFSYFFLLFFTKRL
jgi:hypothetical protein